MRPSVPAPGARCTVALASPFSPQQRRAERGRTYVQVSARGYTTAIAHVSRVVYPDDWCPGCLVYTPVAVQLTPT